MVKRTQGAEFVPVWRLAGGSPGGILFRMAVTLDSIYEEALQLPEESRLLLVEKLIVSSSSYASIEAEQLAEAESRLQDMRSGAVRGVPVAEALERVRQSISGGRPA